MKRMGEQAPSLRDDGHPKRINVLTFTCGYLYSMVVKRMDKSSRNRLTERLLPQFAGDTLFEAIARAVCRAGCLPRKELYEAWEVARRVRRRFRGGRIIDLACGHGLLAQILLLLDDSSPEALAVDRRIPQSAALLGDCLTEAWPRLKGRVSFIEGDLEDVPVHRDDLIVSVHACGGLTDLVLDRALAVGARVAVLPCCHDLTGADLAGLQGWLAGPLAMDVVRADPPAARRDTRYTPRKYRAISPRKTGCCWLNRSDLHRMATLNKSIGDLMRIISAGNHRGVIYCRQARPLSPPHRTTAWRRRRRCEKRWRRHAAVSAICSTPAAASSHRRR